MTLKGATMLHRLSTVSVVTLWLVLAPAAQPQAPNTAETFRVEYVLKTPRGRDPVLGGARNAVFGHAGNLGTGSKFALTRARQAPVSRLPTGDLEP